MADPYLGLSRCACGRSGYGYDKGHCTHTRPVQYAVMESRGLRYRLTPRAWDGPTVLVWNVVGLDRCTRCDAPATVTVTRSSGTDLRAECCGLQLGVLAS